MFLHHVLLGYAGSYRKLTFLGLGLSAVAMVLGFPVLVIAHRMRTVQAADKFVVLSEGRVAEEGSPARLLAKQDGIFRRMTRLQTASAGWSIDS